MRKLDEWFPDELDLRFRDMAMKKRPFMLLANFRYVRSNGEVITVPSGYTTDFASIPRVLHGVFNPIGRYGKAAIVHDWLCDTRKRPSVETHNMFIEAMHALRVKRRTIWALGFAVRIFGSRWK